MRNLIATLSIASLILITFSGCEERHSMRSVPNRDGHAWSDPDKKGGLSMGIQAGEGEIYYNCSATDNLTSVASKFRMSTEELIKRNELKTKELKPKQQLVVRDPNAN